MIDDFQIKEFLEKYQTSQTTILREYVQLSFLSSLYDLAGSERIFFKGGTALRLVFGAERFSEDLDFTVEMKEQEFDKFIGQAFKVFKKKEPVEFKKRKTIAGKKYLMTIYPTIVSYKLFISLDFSFREKAIEPNKAILKTDYPVLFTGYVYHLSVDEILAEKTRAVMSRGEGRDIYDLWFLLSMGARLRKDLVNKKLAYYDLEYDRSKLLKKIKSFVKKEFVLDLRPFVAVDKRERLGELFDFIKAYLEKKLD